MYIKFQNKFIKLLVLSLCFLSLDVLCAQNISKRENYIFNSTINGIEETDLIFLIGTNPRYEATILNARIRKTYLNNNTKIFSLNENGDLTYPYESLDGQTQTLKNIFEGTHNFYPPVDNRRVVLVATYAELDNRIKK